MKIFRYLYLVCILFIGMGAFSQEISIEQLSSVNVDQLSDEQIQDFWDKAQSKGYTLSDLEIAARLNRVPDSQIYKLKQRISLLSTKPKQPNKNQKPMAQSSQEAFGLTGKDRYFDTLSLKAKSNKEKIFGFDFFQNPKISFTPNQNMPTPETYTIATGDNLLIEIWGATESSITQKVDNQGFINIPMAGKVRVGGLSFAETKEKIKSALSKIYSGVLSPDGSYSKIYVGVSLQEVRSVQVNIIGEVAAPGTYSLSALSSVLNALYAAGGPTENGSFRDVQLIRDGKKVSTFDIYQYLIYGSQQGNSSLKDQDVILVPSYQNRVFVEGEVKRKGIYEVLNGETLSDLHKFFGGFSPNAYRDVMVVERIVGAKRSVEEVAINNISSFEIKNGDRLSVAKLSDIFHNKISIAGAVYQPGNYAFKEGMTALDLIERASGVKEDAFLKNGIIFRKSLGENESLDFSVENLLSKTQTITLQPNDSLYIFSKNTIIKKDFVSIEGAVKNPIKVPFREGLRVENLVLLAGGFIQGADPSSIQIGRQLNDQDFKNLSEIIDVSLSEDLLVSAGNTLLQPNDIVTVRFKKGFTPQQVVTIKGEVLHPGVYVIESKQQKISDLIKRAGGFSPFAYPQGATLIRRKNEIDKNQEKSQLENLKNLSSKDEVLSIKEEETEFRVGINLKKILDGKKDYDIILVQGDELIIPEQKQTIEIKGEVLAPSLVRYEKGKTASAYINNAGGFGNNAKKKSVYVVYSNGEVRGTKTFLGIRNYPKIEPGATIIVPQKPERKGLSTTETISITTALTTLAILIYNTFK